MRIHLIATGGAVMHNIAIALHLNGHDVSGSDDEIYNPARDRLARYGLLPEKYGWFPEKITADIDVVILGMHARPDNPELHRAQELGLYVLSYPAFVYDHAREKTRCVVAGSHGKTTTTSMVMHCLKKLGCDFDYVVGAQLEGFDTMARFSDAPMIVIEGDEYLSSPIDPAPKMVRYRPHHAIITGIAWDHINVFPTFEHYCRQFELFLESIEPGGTVFWCSTDETLEKVVQASSRKDLSFVPYGPLAHTLDEGQLNVRHKGRKYPVAFFGEHNLMNAHAAVLLCEKIGIPIEKTLGALSDFKGAARRLQLLAENERHLAWQDFAHAPSKVKATTQAVKNMYPQRRLCAVLELHTFSSLNRDFLPQYRQALQAADRAWVYFSPHTLQMKKLPAISAADVAAAFDHPALEVFTDMESLTASLRAATMPESNYLFMSSGTFDGTDLKTLAGELLS